MSRDLYWRPAQGSSVLCMGCSGLQMALQEVFGDFPIHLSMEDVRILEGMKAATDTENYKSVYDKIMEYITEHGQIVLSIA